MATFQTKSFKPIDEEDVVLQHQADGACLVDCSTIKSQVLIINQGEVLHAGFIEKGWVLNYYYY